MPVIQRIVTGFRNAFRVNDAVPAFNSVSIGPSSSVRPHLPRLRYANERTIISSIYTRIANDFASIEIRHAQLDEKGRYLEDVDSALNRCLTFEANIDQAPRAFRQDIAMTLFDEGVAAIVPVDYSVTNTGEVVEIFALRVGKITDWHPRHVRVSLYNEDKGLREEILLKKRDIAIIENPYYAVMNERISTLSRLIRKLSILDDVDEATGSGKLDIIIQLPYAVKTDVRKAQAEERRQNMEMQLTGSKYGIAYADSTEKITQLNRPAENNLLKQIEYLRDDLYSQLGITKSVMDGTADEATMINYLNRTIEPLLVATIEAMQRSFVGVQGTDGRQRIKFFRNPFKLVPLSDLAVIVDKFSRNEILAPNEIRDIMGIQPSDDPKADKLMNSNMPQPETNDSDDDSGV